MSDFDVVRKALSDPYWLSDPEDGLAALARIEAENERLRAECDAMRSLVAGLKNEEDANAAWRALILRAEAAEAESERLRLAYLYLFGAVSEAEKFDTNAGDSAVSCVLAGDMQTWTDINNRAALGEQP